MHDARTIDLVRTFLGPIVCEALDDPTVMDVLVRPEWVAVDRAGHGLQPLPQAVGSTRIVELLRMLGPLVGQELPEHTVVETQLPGYRARFAGVFLGTHGEQSFFTLRRAIVRGVLLQTYVENGSFGDIAHARFRELITNPTGGLLIAGATGSGKTTFLGSMLTEIVRAHGASEHLVLVEDTPELIVDGPMVTHIVSSTKFPYRTALRAALRHRPTRLIVGEVRGGEALDAVKAGATGHGLMMTVHASSAEGAVRTLLARMAEGVEGRVDERLVCEALHLIAVFRRERHGIRLAELASLAPSLSLERIPLS